MSSLRSSYSFALLCVAAGSRAGVDLAVQGNVQGVPNPKAPKSPVCDSSNILPPEESLKSHFDSQRRQLGVMNASSGEALPKTCTKRDVCLLMRQLDMDFFKRARKGTLTDKDFDTPPEVAWLTDGRCYYNKRGKGFMPIMDAKRCIAQLKNAPVKFVNKRITTVHNSPKYPAGCSIEVDKTKGTKRVIMNTNEKSKANAGHFVSQDDGSKKRSISHWGQNKYVYQLCEQDRTLSESAAAYFSPYKLKQSMVERSQMSTSCSFGMYAYLHYLKETSSSCAQILTYKASKKFHSAQDALDQAKKLEGQGKSKLADEIRQYVEEQRQKFVLIDTVTNHWCPDIWNEALASPGGTCSVPRVINWQNQSAAAEIDGPRYTHIGNQKASLEARAESRQKHGWGATRAGGSGGDNDFGVSGSSAKMGGRLGQAQREWAQEDDKLDNEFQDDFANEQPEDKPAKLALEADFCSTVADETLEDILAGVDTAPPDFFRDAFIPDGTEHPDLKEPAPKWSKHEKAARQAPRQATRQAPVRRHERMASMMGR